MSGEAKAAVELVLQQAEDLGRQLREEKNPGMEGCREHRQATALTLAMIAPIYKAFNNGGLPSKRAGSRLKVGPVEITGETAFRAVLLALVVAAVAMLAGLKVQYGNGQLNIGRVNIEQRTSNIEHPTSGSAGLRRDESNTEVKN